MMGGGQCRQKASESWGQAIHASKQSGIMELNAFQYKHPMGGAVYTQHGMLTETNPHGPLRVPQRRTFLMPEYFNSGCSTEYCAGDEKIYPTGRPACSGPQTSSWNNRELDPYFASTDPYYGNSVPVSMVCYKGITGNSTAGWLNAKPADGTSAVPLWTLGNK